MQYFSIMIVIGLLLYVCSGYSAPNLKRCRVTHSGIEYKGDIGQTKSGIMCQQWETPNPVHKVSVNIKDEDFPEGSKRSAKNYCRNPKNLFSLPWCYALDLDVIDEECNVPICTQDDCRLTGPGVEYNGKKSETQTKEPCLHWIEERKFKLKHLHGDSMFSDGSREHAENYCRNPDGDTGGPWCYIENEYFGETRKLEKEYCGISFCEPRACPMVTSDAIDNSLDEHHTFFSRLPSNTTSLEFSIKLWHPDQWETSYFRFALSVLPVPATWKQLHSWDMGLEVYISNLKTGIEANKDEEASWSGNHPGMLSGTKWTDFVLNWNDGFISLYIKDKSTPIFVHEYGHKLQSLLFQNDRYFDYFSVKGSSALWSFTFCNSEDCQEHVTTQADFIRRWPLRKSVIGYELKLFVRAKHSAIIEMKTASMVQYPSVQLALSNKDNKTILSLKTKDDVSRTNLAEIHIDTFLSYWIWTEIYISILGDRIQVYWIKETGSHNVLDVKDNVVKGLRWFSVGSRSTTAHWTLFCVPNDKSSSTPGLLPECVMTQAEVMYIGTQWISKSGLTCVPWVDTLGLVQLQLKDEQFIDGNKVKAKNYCRNPTKDEEGPFCFVLDVERKFASYKESCYPRKCISKDCRMAGTGSDFIGSIIRTISNRTCQSWSSNTPHMILDIYRDNKTFPEQSVDNASNFCRNPSYDVAGPWCYTTDPNLLVDKCNVPDCKKPGECTVILRGPLDFDRQIYILPHWKSIGLKFWVKIWNPRKVEGLIISVFGLSSQEQYQLYLGDDGNEKVVLYYVDDKGLKKLLKKKTLSHFLPSGRWVGLRLVLTTGELSLSYKDVPGAFFIWKHYLSDGVKAIIPTFLSYTTITIGNVGVYFECEDCQTQITKSKRISAYYPLNLWKKENNNSLMFHLRGSGTCNIVLLRLDTFSKFNLFVVLKDTGTVSVKSNNQTFASQVLKNKTLFNPSTWSKIVIRFTEQVLEIEHQDLLLLTFHALEPLVVYYFSVIVESGQVTWIANCDSPDLDGQPRNGGWSEWSMWECSVTCGGGHGVRRRRCNNPAPNIFGKTCNGSDVNKGICNTFICGDVPPYLYHEMTQSLKREENNMKINVGDKIDIDCNTDILIQLKAVSPTSKVHWTRNGVAITKLQKLSAVVPQNFTLRINSASLEDSGVYTCMLESNKDVIAALKLAVLSVRTQDVTITTRATRSIVLKCHASVLSYLFNDLGQVWTVNGKIWKDYGASVTNWVDIDEIKSLKMTDSGEWECVVTQDELNLTWVTSWFRLEVKSPPTILTNLMDDKYLGPIIGIFGSETGAVIILIFIFCVFAFLIGVGSYCIIMFNRRRDLMNKQRRNSPSFIEISSKALPFKILRSSMLNYEDSKTEEGKSLIKSAADVSDSDAYTDTDMADSDNVNVKHGNM